MIGGSYAGDPGNVRPDTAQADGDGIPDGRLDPQEAGERFAVPAHGSGRGISKAKKREMKGTENIHQRIEEVFDECSLNR